MGQAVVQSAFVLVARGTDKQQGGKPVSRCKGG